METTVRETPLQGIVGDRLLPPCLRLAGGFCDFGGIAKNRKDAPANP